MLCNKLFATIGVGFSFIALAICASLILNKQVTDLIKSIHTGQSIDNISVLSRINDMLAYSMTINPLNPNTYLLIAEKYELEGDAENAKRCYLKALDLQPNWDYGWAKFAAFLSKQDVFDYSGFLIAFKTSLTLGLYENNNQQILIPLIFNHWYLIKEDEQTFKKVETQLKHVFKYYYNADLALDSAIKFNKLCEIEPFLTHHWHYERITTSSKVSKNYYAALC